MENRIAFVNLLGGPLCLCGVLRGVAMFYVACGTRSDEPLTTATAIGLIVRTTSEVRTSRSTQ